MRPRNQAVLACTLVLLALHATLAQAQSGGYEVTASLSPFFVHPITGVDLTQGHPFDQVLGLERGADGKFYALRFNNDVFELDRVDPATGQVNVLVVAESFDGTLSGFYRGINGRLYFTIADGGQLLYAAPGYTADVCGWRGCVFLLDTAAPSAPLTTLYGFRFYWEGFYPDGIAAEDVDGNVYVYTSYGEACLPVSGVLLRITGPDDADVLCEPPFDWGTVTLSDNRWNWSDGLSYYYASGGIFQYAAPSDPVRLATINAADGVSFGGLVEGSGYLYGLTQSGGALGGGVVFRVRVPSLASPDLQITALSSPPTVAAPGEAFSVTDTTHNAGPEPAASSYNAYFLSASGDTPDIRLTNNRYLDELAPGQEATGSRNVKVPVSVLVGSYWLMACADGGADVPEQEEGNNCALAATKVLIGNPDLRQRDVSVSSTSITPGAKMVVTDTVDNPNAVAALASTTRYYLSLNSARDGGDVLLTGKRSIQGLAGGGVNQGSATVTIPNPVAAGAYHVLACADDLAKVKESDEANNCAATAATLLIGQPDLATTTMAAPPETTTPGGKFTITDSVTNQGNAPAISTSSRYLLSLNATKDGADILLNGARSVTQLLPGQTSSGSRSVTVPLTAAVGSYYVLACADDTQKVQESSEANNCLASATQILVGWPDLLTTTVSNPPADLAIGATFTITDTVSNQGNVSAGASTTRYYFSLDAIRSAADVLLPGTRSVPTLSPGANSSGSKSVTVPAVAANAYYVLACADDAAKVGEGDDANNCRASAVTTSVHP